MEREREGGKQKGEERGGEGGRERHGRHGDKDNAWQQHTYQPMLHKKMT